MWRRRLLATHPLSLQTTFLLNHSKGRREHFTHTSDINTLLHLSNDSNHFSYYLFFIFPRRLQLSFPASRTDTVALLSLPLLLRLLQLHTVPCIPYLFCFYLYVFLLRSLFYDSLFMFCPQYYPHLFYFHQIQLSYSSFQYPSSSPPLIPFQSPVLSVISYLFPTFTFFSSQQPSSPLLVPFPPPFSTQAPLPLRV